AVHALPPGGDAGRGRDVSAADYPFERSVPLASLFTLRRGSAQKGRKGEAGTRGFLLTRV
ncbi:MAG: hypothetical protein V1918_00335, partial [Planctomycetota bacterium]